MSIIRGMSAGREDGCSAHCVYSVILSASRSNTGPARLSCTDAMILVEWGIFREKGGRLRCSSHELFSKSASICTLQERYCLSCSALMMAPFMMIFNSARHLFPMIMSDRST